MGIAAVDMSEKNNKSNSPADNTKSEKKMTKYDLKMQRRQEEEKKAKKEKAIIKTGCILAVIICVCIAAWKFYDNYQEKHGPYITVGDHEIQKAEFDYYYYSSLNSFASTYGSYLSYFGLDTSKPLDQQQYSDTMTWDDYFQQQAVNQLKNVYALTDEANEKVLSMMHLLIMTIWSLPLNPMPSSRESVKMNIASLYLAVMQHLKVSNHM